MVTRLSKLVCFNWHAITAHLSITASVPTWWNCILPDSPWNISTCHAVDDWGIFMRSNVMERINICLGIMWRFYANPDAWPVYISKGGATAGRAPLSSLHLLGKHRFQFSMRITTWFRAISDRRHGRVAMSGATLSPGRSRANCAWATIWRPVYPPGP